MRTLIASPFNTLFLCLGLYLLLALPALFSTQHFLFNLEPYPDSFYYLLPPVGLLKKGVFGLVHQSSQIKVTLPPLYSLVMVPLIALVSLPVAFYFTNFMLGAITLSSIWLTIWHQTRSQIWAGISGFLTLAHAYLLWLLAVPMAENLSIALFSCLLCLITYLTTRKKVITTKDAYGLSLLICALPWTKFSLVLVAGLLTVLIGILLLKQRQPKVIRAFCLGLSLGAGLFLAYQIGWLGFNPMEILRPQLETKSNTSIIAFSFEYMLRNIKFYGAAFFGGTTRFLWQTVGLTSGLVSAISLIGIGRYIRDTKMSWLVIAAILQISGLLLIQLPFYVADARYVVAGLPALIILATLGLQALRESWLGLSGSFIMAGLVFASLISTQAPLYRQIIANNVLHRSQAWQYESILHFNSYFANQVQATLITVLPPYLTDIYQQSSYEVLPLSSHQEFMNVRQRPWGVLRYDDLRSEYQKRLKAGENLFVTNAYLSSQHEFNQDWQLLNEAFKLELVSEGCHGTCNIYKIGNVQHAE